MTFIIIGCAIAIAAVGWFVLEWFGRGLDELDSMAEDSDGEWLL